MNFWKKPISIMLIIIIAFIDLKIIVDYEFTRPIEKYNIVSKKKTVAQVIDFSNVQPEEAIEPEVQEEQEETLELREQEGKEKDGSESDQVNFGALASALSDDPIVGGINVYQVIEPTPEEVSEEPVSTEPEPEPTHEPEVTSESSSTGADIVAKAKEYLGYSYVAGGASPDTGFDCSGFTQYIYGEFGIRLNRVANAQADNGTEISKSELQPGDLVLFSYYGSDSIGHSGIYIGDGQFIHAANSNRGVVIDTLESGYYLDNYVTARRVF